MPATMSFLLTARRCWNPDVASVTEPNVRSASAVLAAPLHAHSGSSVAQSFASAALAGHAP